MLLQLFDKIKPGIVNWNKVNKPPFKQMGGKMKKIENCNYAVELGHELKFSLIGIGGEDIHNKTKTLVLGKGAVIIYTQGWGRRENGWVTKKIMT